MNKDNNKYCACTGEEAQYHIHLNQQGPQGPQGPQGRDGNDGISPVISVEDSTDTNYQLRVTTAYDTFVTPNLKGKNASSDITPWTLKGDPPVFTKVVQSGGKVEAGIQQVVKAYLPMGTSTSVNWNDSRTLEVYRNGVLTSKTVMNLLNTNSIKANEPIVVTNNNGILTFDLDDTDLQPRLESGANIRIVGNTIDAIVPTKTSELNNDSGYVTNTELDNKGYVTTSSLNVILQGYAETDEVISELDLKQDKFATVSDSTNITTLNTNGKALSIDSPTIAVGDNLVNNINGENTQLYLKQGDIEAGDNITIDKTATGIKITSTGGGSGGDTNGKYGIRGDYATHYGISDCPNGLIDHNATGKQITVNAGIVMQLPGNTVKTTIASAITKTLESNANITLFYAAGEILEVGKVDYSTTEPEDNGVGNYQAWYNPQVGKWKLKSNDTGNVWRETVATPIANVYLNDANITRIDYIGYRILDDDIIPQQSDIENPQDTIDVMQQTINQLETRLAALEANINGGNA